MTNSQPRVDDELVDRVFKALAARPRRRILTMLASGVPLGGDRCCEARDVCACELSEDLGLSASTISHHMKTLVEAELVSARKEGQWVYYTLRPEVISAVSDELAAIVTSCCRRD